VKTNLKMTGKKFICAGISCTRQVDQILNQNTLTSA
jgi:hypothetical protein